MKGGDQLISDREAFEIIAATDTTTAPNLKSPRLLGHIRKRMKVKYGVSLSGDGVEKRSLVDIPYFPISIPAKDLVSLADTAISGEQSDLSRALERKMPAQLIQENKVLEGASGVGRKTPYARPRKIFEEILAASAKKDPASDHQEVLRDLRTPCLFPRNCEDSQSCLQRGEYEDRDPLTLQGRWRAAASIFGASIAGRIKR